MRTHTNAQSPTSGIGPPTPTPAASPGCRSMTDHLHNAMHTTHTIHLHNSHTHSPRHLNTHTHTHTHRHTHTQTHTHKLTRTYTQTQTHTHRHTHTHTLTYITCCNLHNYDVPLFLPLLDILPCLAFFL